MRWTWLDRQNGFIGDPNFSALLPGGAAFCNVATDSKGSNDAVLQCPRVGCRCG